MSFVSNVSKAMSVHKRKLGGLGIIAGLVGLQYMGLNPIGNIFKTPGVQNIENRYSSGGGSKNHTPGAASPRGSSEKVLGNVQKEQGIGTEKFQKAVGEQKPAPSGFDKAWNSNNYGQDKGK